MDIALDDKGIKSDGGSDKLSYDALPLLDTTRTKTKSRTKYIIATTVLLIIVVIIVSVYLYISDESSSESINIGLFGEWSVHGGNIQNTQIPSKPNNVILT
eukprot:112707_1